MPEYVTDGLLLGGGTILLIVVLFKFGKIWNFFANSVKSMNKRKFGFSVMCLAAFAVLGLSIALSLGLWRRSLDEYYYLFAMGAWVVGVFLLGAGAPDHPRWTIFISFIFGFEILYLFNHYLGANCLPPRPTGLQPLDWVVLKGFCSAAAKNNLPWYSITAIAGVPITMAAWYLRTIKNERDQEGTKDSLVLSKTRFNHEKEMENQKSFVALLTQCTGPSAAVRVQAIRSISIGVKLDKTFNPYAAFKALEAALSDLVYQNKEARTGSLSSTFVTMVQVLCELHEHLFGSDKYPDEAREALVFKDLVICDAQFDFESFSSVATFEDCSFIRCRFQKTILNGSRFDRCLFDSCKFVRSSLEDCQFVKTTFTQSTMFMCVFSKSRFMHSTLIRDCKITNCAFDETRWKNSRIVSTGNKKEIGSKANPFNEMKFESCMFYMSLMENCSFWRVGNNNIYFEGCTWIPHKPSSNVPDHVENFHEPFENKKLQSLMSQMDDGENPTSEAEMKRWIEDQKAIDPEAIKARLTDTVKDVKVLRLLKQATHNHGGRKRLKAVEKMAGILDWDELLSDTGRMGMMYNCSLYGVRFSGCQLGHIINDKHYVSQRKNIEKQLQVIQGYMQKADSPRSPEEVARHRLVTDDHDGEDWHSYRLEHINDSQKHYTDKDDQNGKDAVWALQQIEWVYTSGPNYDSRDDNFRMSRNRFVDCTIYGWADPVAFCFADISELKLRHRQHPMLAFDVMHKIGHQPISKAAHAPFDIDNMHLLSLARAATDTDWIPERYLGFRSPLKFPYRGDEL